MVCKSSIQFSVDGQDCIPSLLFDLRPNNDGGNEDNGNFLQKIPCKHRYTQCPWPCGRPPSTMPPLETSGSRRVWVSLLWGHCSFLLGPGAHKILFVSSKSRFPQSCVSSGGSMVGLTATSSKRAYAILRSAAPRAPAPEAGHCWPIPSQETLKHSSGSISVGSLGPGVHKFVWALCLWWIRDLILNPFLMISPLLPSCWGLYSISSVSSPRHVWPRPSELSSACWETKACSTLGA